MTALRMNAELFRQLSIIAEGKGTTTTSSHPLSWAFLSDANGITMQSVVAAKLGSFTHY